MKKIYQKLLVLIVLSIIGLGHSQAQDDGGLIIVEGPVGGKGDAPCTIYTNTLSVLTYCAGDPITVGYFVTDPCTPTFPLDILLSDEQGLFTDPVTIGSCETVNQCTATIPYTTARGTKYRIRVDKNSSLNNGQDIRINAAPVVALSQSSVSVCVGGTTSSDDLSASGADTYTWSPATFLNSTTGSKVLATPTVAGAITYTVTGTFSVTGCTNTAKVTLNPLNLSVNAGADQNICQGGSAILNATGADSYIWSPAVNLNTTTGASVSTTVLNTIDSYSFVVTGIRTGCFNATDEVVVTVSTGITVNAGSDVNICYGESAELTATGGSAYTWSPIESLNASTGVVVVASPTASTVYSVTSVSGICSSVDSVQVFVFSLPTLNSNPDITVCSGSTFEIILGGPGNYSWEPAYNGEIVMVGDTTIATIRPLETSSLVITTAGLACSATDTIQIVVNSLPTVTISPGENITINMGSPVTLTASGASSYSWSPADNLSASTGASVIFTSSAGNTFYITVAGEGQNGCSSGTSTTIVTIPSNGITEHNTLRKIAVFPNPYKGFTNIEFETVRVANVKIEVFNLLGQSIKTIVNSEIPPGAHRYNFSALQNNQPAGMYFIMLSVDGKTNTVRVAETN